MLCVQPKCTLARPRRCYVQSCVSKCFNRNCCVRVITHREAKGCGCQVEPCQDMPIRVRHLQAIAMPCKDNLGYAMMSDVCVVHAEQGGDVCTQVSGTANLSVRHLMELKMLQTYAFQNVAILIVVCVLLCICKSKDMDAKPSHAKICQVVSGIARQ